MARTYDFTRCVNSTFVSATVVIPDFTTMSFRSEKVEQAFNGTVTEADAVKMLEKAYPFAKIESVQIRTVSAMLGWNLADILDKAADLNPCTRQPWNDGMTAEQKAAVWVEYNRQQVIKAGGKA